jgi:diguanylate cyclase (GGDEF)-like protein
VTRTPAFGLLGGTLVVQLVADAAFAVLNLAGTYHTGHPVDALILIYNVGLGAAALHPSMAAVTDPQPPLSARVGWRRLAVLTLASLLAPVVLLGQILAGDNLDLAVTAAGGVLLFLLVLARMAGLVRTLDRTLASRQALERELEHLVHHDPLTGLANRRLFNDRLAGAIAAGAAPALLYLDLDGFKRTNDELGHAAGDALLTGVSARLSGCVRGADTVARLGGDEFAVLLPGADEAEAARVAMRVLDALATPVALEGADVQVRASIGVAVAAAGQDPEQLLHHADLAMYRVKAAGTGRFEFFDPAG